MAKALAGKANFGLAKKTWEVYQTALNHLERCRVETGMDMSLPFTKVKTLQLVGWMEARGLKSGTMATYLSGVRAIHIACCYEVPSLRDPLVNQILKGQDNFDKVQKRINGKVGRLPVTINMMKLLKKNLVKVSWPLEEKRIFWAIATVAFAGSFRIHELCSKQETEFCEQTTLVWSDVSYSNVNIDSEAIQSLSVLVKSPKVDRVGTISCVQLQPLRNISRL